MEIDNAAKLALAFLNADWVMWLHEGTKPAETYDEKGYYSDVGTVFGALHCARCLNLNRNYFIRSKCPDEVLHPNCHCRLIPLAPPSVKAECPENKFKYVFSQKDKNDKLTLFEEFGYTDEDINTLIAEYKMQAELKYMKGEYRLFKLDSYGQRINIVIDLPSKDKDKSYRFNSGWMVYPDGRIALVTPFGGWKTHRDV